MSSPAAATALFCKDIQHINMTDLDQALRKDKPTTEGRPIKPIHMLVCYNGNPVAVSPNVNELVKNLKRDDLLRCRL